MSQTSHVLTRKFMRPPTISSFWLASIIFLGSFLVVVIFALLTYQIYFLHRIYLGVQVDGIDVSQMHPDQVQHLVAVHAQDILNRPITLVSNEGSFTLTAEELGARVDVGQTINMAYAVGRQGRFARDLKQQLRILNQPINILPVIEFDTGPANTVLLNISRTLNHPARNAQLRLNPDLSIDVTPAETGRSVDVMATREAIRNAILMRSNAPVELVERTAPPAITEVEPARQALQALLSAPLVFTFNERTWSLSPAELAKMIIIGQEEPFDAPGRVTVAFNQATLAAYFYDLAREINQPAINAWFNLDTSTWTLYPTIASQNGYTLDVPAAVAKVASLWQTPTQHQLALPVKVEPPAVPVATAEQLGIKELVSSATTYFKGSSAGRVQNIKVAASKFNGLVIPPGAVYSFNKYLGDVTAENGFVESLIIQGDRTAVGIGGGVCQVSTTVFRAAFLGGFEIVERWAHGYRVSWYETGSVPGLDATIYTPDVDFKFRNDTNSYILIQTNTDPVAGTVTFNFYGTSPHRTVIVSDPIESNVVKHGPDIYQEDPSLKPGEVKQVDWAKDGVDVTIYRTVKEGDTIIHQDTLFSRYRPWQNVYKVGPGTKR